MATDNTIGAVGLGRRCLPAVKFNGKSVSKFINDYVEKVVYDDVASGDSDTLTLQLHNVDMIWLKSWFPVKGDRVTVGLMFYNWYTEGKNRILVCGDFLLDQANPKGGPLTENLDCISLPTNTAINSTKRTKTWKEVTTKQIAAEIAAKYSLTLLYDAPEYTISSLEQTTKTDSAFLYDICKDYGLGMKLYNNRIVIYGKSDYEKKKAAAVLNRSSFIDDNWEIVDTLTGTYTGAKASYKNSKTGKTVSVYVGLVAEDDPKARTYSISEQFNDATDARIKAAAKVNLENEKACTLSGTITARPEIVAGMTVKVEGFGKYSGKYFVDEVKTTVSDSGTSQDISLHRCAKQVEAIPTAGTKKSGSFEVGDVVQFNGGTHYVTSYASAKGYSAKAGKATITKINDAGAHPYHLIHKGSGNVYGWVDAGTFTKAE